MTGDGKHTRTRPVRVPDGTWDAYGRVCDQLQVTRTGDLLDHMRDRIQAHGDEQDLADLERGERELTERRSRKGGRPPKSADQ